MHMPLQSKNHHDRLLRKPENLVAKPACVQIPAQYMQTKENKRTTFMSTRSSSNQAVVSLSLNTLAMYMHAKAIIYGGYISIRSILYVSFTRPLTNVTDTTVSTQQCVLL